MTTTEALCLLQDIATDELQLASQEESRARADYHRQRAVACRLGVVALITLARMNEQNTDDALAVLAPAPMSATR